MNPAASYLEAAIPEPVRCLGLLLKPFCLGHYMTLARYDCAIVDESPRELTKDDIVFGTLVCHFSYEEFNDFIRQKDSVRQVKKWGKRIGIFSIKEHGKRLLEYVRTAQDLPGFVLLQEREELRSGSHWSQSLLLVLTGELGYTHSEAMNVPLKKAFSDWLKYAENNGVIRFLNADELKQLDDLKKQEGRQDGAAD